MKKTLVMTEVAWLQTYRHHFFTERVINTWNHLETEVIEAGTINTFKSRLQKLHDKDESVFGSYSFS